MTGKKLLDMRKRGRKLESQTKWSSRSTEYEIDLHRCTVTVSSVRRVSYTRSLGVNYNRRGRGSCTGRVNYKRREGRNRTGRVNLKKRGKGSYTKGNWAGGEA